MRLRLYNMKRATTDTVYITTVCASMAVFAFGRDSGQHVVVRGLAQVGAVDGRVVVLCAVAAVLSAVPQRRFVRVVVVIVACRSNRGRRGCGLFRLFGRRRRRRQRRRGRRDRRAARIGVFGGGGRRRQRRLVIAAVAAVAPVQVAAAVHAATAEVVARRRERAADAAATVAGPVVVAAAVGLFAVLVLDEVHLGLERLVRGRRRHVYGRRFVRFRVQHVDERLVRLLRWRRYNGRGRRRRGRCLDEHDLIVLLGRRVRYDHALLARRLVVRRRHVYVYGLVDDWRLMVRRRIIITAGRVTTAAAETVGRQRRGRAAVLSETGWVERQLRARTTVDGGEWRR